jgi:hypothetical protein
MRDYKVRRFPNKVTNICVALIFASVSFVFFPKRMPRTAELIWLWLAYSMTRFPDDLYLQSATLAINIATAIIFVLSIFYLGGWNDGIFVVPFAFLIFQRWTEHSYRRQSRRELRD